MMKALKIIGISFGTIIGIGIAAIIVLTILTSDGFASITDLINKDTDQIVVDENFNFSDSNTQASKIGSIFSGSHIIPFCTPYPPP